MLVATVVALGIWWTRVRPRAVQVGPTNASADSDDASFEDVARLAEDRRETVGSASAETGARTDDGDRTTVSVRSRLGLPLADLQWRAVGEEAWSALETSGTEALLALPAREFEVRCRAHATATSSGAEDVVLEPLASLLLETNVEGAFTRGLSQWSAMQWAPSDHPVQRAIEASTLPGLVEGGFAVAVDPGGLRRAIGDHAIWIGQFSFRSCVLLQVQWRPEEGVHVAEALEATLFEPVPSSALRVVPRVAGSELQSTRLQFRLVAGSRVELRRVERTWGGLIYSDVPLLVPETQVTTGAATFEALPLNRPYTVFVHAEDGTLFGRTRFTFDESNVYVDLHPGLVLSGRIELRGSSVPQSPSLEVTVELDEPALERGTWNVRTKLPLAPDGSFRIQAVGHERIDESATYPPPRSGSVRLEVVGFEPWRDERTWPSDRSDLDLGTISLGPRAPDVILPSSARREGGSWTAVLTESGGWNVAAQEHVGEHDWLRLEFEGGEKFRAGSYERIAVLYSGSDFDNVAGFELAGTAWAPAESSSYRVHLETGAALGPSDHVSLAYVWHGIEITFGGYDRAHFEDDRAVTYEFSGPAEGLSAIGILHSPTGLRRQDLGELRPGESVFRVF